MVAGEMKLRAARLFSDLQSSICNALEHIDGVGHFGNDAWKRPTSDSLSDGGGGLTRVLRNGAIFESAGVNFSEVYGELSPEMGRVLVGTETPQEFYATGTSLVLHPFSPMVPTVHANFRYFEVGELYWFGGGADLTPYYLFEEDARHFHQVWLEACGEQWYRECKEHCDRYFYLPHRQEARGIGGIFFDYLGKGEPGRQEEYFEQCARASAAFLDSYLPIVERRRDEPWGEEQKRFQLLRRGRYVEFNLIYDRGTQFGLKTNGRTESILMSLPPTVCWEYQFQPEAGSREASLLEVLRSPRSWV